jgi:hypothetical protein
MSGDPSKVFADEVTASDEVIVIPAKNVAVGYRLAGGIFVNQYSGGMLDGWRVTSVEPQEQFSHVKINAKEPDSSNSVVLYLDPGHEVAIYRQLISTKDQEYEQHKAEVTRWSSEKTRNGLTSSFANLLLALCERVEKLQSHQHDQTDVNGTFYGVTTSLPRMQD